MAMTDPIADMLTRIRNANSVYHEKVEIPSSKIKIFTDKKLTRRKKLITIWEGKKHERQ